MPRRGPLLRTLALVLFSSTRFEAQVPQADEGGLARGGLDPAAESLGAGHRALAAGALEEARERLEEMLLHVPADPNARLGLARTLNALGRPAEALTALAPVAEAVQRSPWMQAERGRALRQLGRSAEAEGALRAALELYPAHGIARVALVELLVDGGRCEEARTLLEPLLASHAQATEVVLARSRALECLGRFSENETHLRAALERGAAPEVALAFCRWLVREGRAKEAWDVAAPALLRLPDPAARTFLAQVARRADRPLESLALLGSVLLEDPAHGDALEVLGELLEHVDDLHARVAARRVEIRPQDLEAWHELLESELDRGRWEAFFERLGTVPEDLRARPAVARLEGRALRRLGRENEARLVLEPLCASGDARACYELGLVHYARGENERARGAFERGAVGAWAADAHFNRGVCLDRLGRYAEAVGAYREALRLRPELAEAWLQIGHDLRLRLGDADGAREAYRAFLALGGDDAVVRRYLGER